jgi:hypothetical protein
LIIHRAGGRGKVKDGVNLAFHKNVIGYIMVNEGELSIPRQMSDVVSRSGEEIIQAYNFMPLRQKTVT